MGRRTARVSVKRCQMPRRGVGGLAISLPADAVDAYLRTHPDRRMRIETAIEHGAIRKIAESEVTEND